ncbi:MAG: hypothetical protein NZ932_01670 [Candidatus Bathyarchaeota archaeon]|nr:hypothetical protein [Candidatus Bathyarchaeota archaeon]MDW8040038.1 hypothetical protein [Nitrososphaerota archaeon]
MSKREGKSRGLDLNSRFWRTFFTLIAAALIFAGPTYSVLVLWRVLDLDYALSMVSGLLLFVVGFAFLVLLIKRAAIS